VTRFWADGVAIAVTCDALATPQAFIWEQQRHIVLTVCDRWRVEEGWWRQRVYREYFQVVTRSGLPAEIYHDVLTARWYLQRVYD